MPISDNTHELKLYVGCGRKKLPGYRHQDIVKYPHVDYLSPCWNVAVPDGTFDEVYSRHLLEHLIPLDAKRTMREWHRILKPRGLLVVIVPDLEYHAKQLLTPGQSPLPGRNISNFDHAINSIYGWVRENKGQPGMEHRWGYTRQSLAVLVATLFAEVGYVDSRPWEIHLTARKSP